MKPIDYRDATWEQIRGHLNGLREAVWRAFAEWGPGTTREIAEKSGIDLLTFRPRTTELFQLGFLKLVADDAAAGGSDPGPPGPVSQAASGHEGTYAACALDEALAGFHARVKAARDPQLTLPLTT